MLRRSLVLVVAVALAAVFASSSPAAVPHRIVSLSPTATETLFAIGAGKQVVAVDNDSTYPAQAPRTKLSGVTPNVEAIAAYRPDLVVIAYDPGGLADALAKLKIPVLDQDAAKTFAGAYAQIRRLGALTGQRAGAAALVARMKARIAKAVASAHGRGRGLTVYHELDPTLYSVTSDTFAGQVYRLFGLKDIADAADKTGSGYPQLSAEYVVASDPDLIVLADTVCCGQTRATVSSRPGWSGIHAVRDGEVVRLDDSIASRWGPRIVDFVRAVASALRHLPGVSAVALVLRLARPRRRVPLWGAAAVALLLGSLLLGALVGPAHIGVVPVLRSLLAHAGLPVAPHLSATDDAILWQIRLPRVVLGALVGAILATAGASYQGVFRNPLADPYLLGVAAGAGLGATLAVAYAPARALLPPAAFAGGMVAVGLTYLVGRSAGGDRSGTTFVLAGVTVVSFFTALQTFVQQQHSDTLKQVYSWILGSLPSSGWRDVWLLLPYAGFALVALLAHRRLLDVLSLGDEEAASLGVDVGRVRLFVVVAATVGTAGAVAVSGLIGFVGIVVPHALRLVVGPSYRVLLPLSIVVGAAFLVLADVVARTALSPAELPIGVVTAFCGAPFFAVVLRTSRKLTG